MKKTILFLTFLAASQLAPRLFGNTFTVNNMNPSPGQYTTVAAAITAAAVGDTILVTGSPTGYGTFSVTKNNLVFIGAGHNPQKVPVYASYVDNFNFNSNINGCKIMGFNLLGTNQVTNLDNLTVEFCMVRGTLDAYTGCDNWTIKNCVFTATNGCGINGGNVGGHTNTIITNNIFDKSTGICNFPIGGNTGMIISNNVFLRSTVGDDGVLSNLDNATVDNNIFYQSSAAHPTSSNISNIVFHNNISFNATNNSLPSNNCPTCSGSGNIVNTDPLFTTYTSGQNFAYAYNFILQAGSPGKNAGLDGTDIGVYGLGNTFSETGEPPIPVIRTVTIANPNTASGAVLNVTVTASNPDADQ